MLENLPIDIIKLISETNVISLHKCTKFLNNVLNDVFYRKYWFNYDIYLLKYDKYYDNVGYNLNLVTKNAQSVFDIQFE